MYIPVEEFVSKLFPDDSGLLQCQKDAVDNKDNRVMWIQHQEM